MPRIIALVLGASLGLAAACAPSAPTPDRTPSPSSAASPVVSAAPSSPDCEPLPQSGLLPSDRLVDLKVSSTSTQDLVTFVFEPSTPGPGGPPRGTLDPARPPYSHAGSGQSIALLGERAVQVRFSGMTIASETGEAVYRGPADVRPGFRALREAIQFDGSEGVIGWYIGYDGPGCVTLERSGNDVTVMIELAGTPPG